MRYIIDGNNLMGKLLKRVENKDESRKKVIDFILKRFKNPKKKVLIVFDGHEESFLREGLNFGGIKVTFANSVEADDKIIHILRKSKNVNEEIVITSDLELQKRVKYFGAKTKTVEEFLSEFNQKEKKETLPEAKLSPKNVDINFWMDFFKKRGE